MRKALALAVIALGLTGCAADDGMAHLSVQKSASDDQFVASFDRALFTESPGGVTDLVLLSGEQLPTSPDAAGRAVRQVVHVRVLWNPTRTIRLDSPSAGNAMVDWTISAGDTDRVTYTGSCWARVSVDGDEADVDLREATVSVRQVKGQMADPLQRAKLSGKFVAKRSDATVRTYVEEIAASARRSETAALPRPAAVTP